MRFYTPIHPYTRQRAQHLVALLVVVLCTFGARPAGWPVRHGGKSVFVIEQLTCFCRANCAASLCQCILVRLESLSVVREAKFGLGGRRRVRVRKHDVLVGVLTHLSLSSLFLSLFSIFLSR